MTVKLKTMKTGDVDIQGGAAQTFLQEMYGEESSGSVDGSRTKITGQQKTKYILHLSVVIGSHIFIFWYLPIHGNMLLYGQPMCDESQEPYYACMNFHRNWHIRTFYLLLCVYLAISALQIRYGFPIMRKPSSTMQYYGELPNLGAIVYAAIPFAIELRCIFDFTFSKTALDNFQFWQLF